MKEYFTLDNFDFFGKVVGLRVDINSPQVNGKVVQNERIVRAAKTIKELSKKGAKVVVLAHQGRKGTSDCVSLKEHKRLLEEKLEFKVSFVAENYSESLEKKVIKSKAGSVFLLENLRFFDDEKQIEKEDNQLKKLSSFFDLYVFDAFSVAHRNSYSVAHMNKEIPHIAGRLMERELQHLDKLDSSKSPHIFSFGGAKPDDLLVLMKKDLEEKRVDKIVLSGIIGELGLLCKGVNLGAKVKFLEEKGYLEKKDELLELMTTYKDKILVPVDVAYFNGKERVEVLVSELEDHREDLEKYLIQDIGMKTVDEYEKIFKKAGSIYFKGPCGNFEEEAFEKGTKNLLVSIVNSKAFSFMGGGHSVTAAKMFNVLTKFSYVSLAGGALVYHLSGEVLPGIEDLKASFKSQSHKHYDIVVLGSNTLDIKVDVPEKLSQLEIGTKVKVNQNFKFSSGGGGVNACVSLSRLGAKVGYLGKISLENKEQLQKDLKPYKIDIISSHDSKRACAKSVLLQTKDKDRVIFTFRGQNAYLEEKDFEYGHLGSNNILLTGLTGKSFQTMTKLARKLKRDKKNSLIGLIPSSYQISGEKNLKKLLRLCDVVIFNFDEAKELTGDRDITSCLGSVYEMGPEMVVITDGSHGAFAYNGKKEFFQRAKKPLRVVDTTGAGDCFAATFFYFYSKNFGTKTSLLYASKNASALITKNGAQKGSLSYNELILKKKA